MDPVLTSPTAARLAIGIWTREADLEAALTRRFELEFGAVVESWREKAERTLCACWLLFEDPVGAARLATMQAHLRRVARLYPPDGAGTRVRLHAACVDAHRVTLAFDGDSPCRVALGSEVWAEVAIIWAEGSGWASLFWTPKNWMTESGRAFWTRAREASLRPPTPTLSCNQPGLSRRSWPRSSGPAPDW